MQRPLPDSIYYALTGDHGDLQLKMCHKETALWTGHNAVHGTSLGSSGGGEITGWGRYPSFAPFPCLVHQYPPFLFLILHLILNTPSSLSPMSAIHEYTLIENGDIQCVGVYPGVHKSSSHAESTTTPCYTVVCQTLPVYLYQGSTRSGDHAEYEAHPVLLSHVADIHGPGFDGWFQATSKHYEFIDLRGRLLKWSVRLLSRTWKLTDQQGEIVAYFRRVGPSLRRIGTVEIVRAEDLAQLPLIILSWRLVELHRYMNDRSVKVWRQQIRCRRTPTNRRSVGWGSLC
ncbi:hypothetical protein DL89DRAFT_270902, partial [Linderina pennispora]